MESEPKSPYHIWFLGPNSTTVLYLDTLSTATRQLEKKYQNLTIWGPCTCILGTAHAPFKAQRVQVSKYDDIESKKSLPRFRIWDLLSMIKILPNHICKNPGNSDIMKIHTINRNTSVFGYLDPLKFAS